MQLEDIWELDPVCGYQNTSVPSVICSVVLLYQGIDSIWEIFCVTVLGSVKKYLH
jgi:hypothetical protein